MRERRQGARLGRGARRGEDVQAARLELGGEGVADAAFAAAGDEDGFLLRLDCHGGYEIGG